MGRFAQKYSPEQKQAICEAVLDQGLTRPQAIARAKAGKLGEYERFTMPIASLDHYLKLERRKREGWAAAANSQTPLERLDHFTTRTLNLLEYGLDKLERNASRSKGLTKDDADQMKRLTQVAREVKALGFNVAPIHGSSGARDATRKAAKADDEARKQGEGAPTLSDKMVRDMESEPAPEGPTSPGSDSGDRDDGALASHAAPASTQGEGAEGGGVHAPAAQPSELVPT